MSEQGDRLRKSAAYYAMCAEALKHDADLVDQAFVAEYDRVEDGFLLSRGDWYFRRGGVIYRQPNDSRMWMPLSWPEAPRVKHG